MDALIEAYKKNFDISLIYVNLQLTVQQRFEQMISLQKLYAELQKAGVKIKHDRS